MHWPLKLLVIPFTTALLAFSPPLLAAPKQTVCTITVNSADEKETFRQYLPESKYNFVELVENGQPDWLASSCRAKTACDVLIISGHFDGSNEFFSDRVEAHDFLTVSELERVSCSNSCPSLFSRLKEVYLFGCNTLNPQPQSSASAEIVRDLVHEGLSPKEAKKQLQSLNAAHGQSSRDRMRQVFNGVPEIYGFSSMAPLGPVAASTLNHYFRTNGKHEVGLGRTNSRLLRAFAPFSMAVAKGMTDDDPHAQARQDMCQFADDRLPLAKKLAFVHQLLQRPNGEAKLYLDRIQRLAATLDDTARQTPALARVFKDIAADTPTRTRFLEDARAAEQPPMRVELVNLARDLGWLSEDQRWQELALMLGELQAKQQVGVPEVDLACRLNPDHELDDAFNRRVPPGSDADDVPHAAVRACLGSSEGRERTLEGLVSLNESDVQAAQAYLRHRPVTNDAELRRVATGIVLMEPGDPQVRALEVLGRHYVSDRAVLLMLAELYTKTPSIAVQNAIAGVLIRADRSSMGSAELLRTLIEHRQPASAGGEMLDALVARLQSP